MERGAGEGRNEREKKTKGLKETARGKDTIEQGKVGSETETERDLRDSNCLLHISFSSHLRGPAALEFHVLTTLTQCSRNNSPFL